jgi:hypothetical protein
MANWVLAQEGQVIPRCTICRLKKDECSASNEVEAAKRAAYTAEITLRLGDSVNLHATPLPHQNEPDWNIEPYGYEDTPSNEPFEADLVDAGGQPLILTLLTDALI